MDQQLRELRRQALAGDPIAALQYFYALKRSEPRTSRSSLDGVTVQIQRPWLRGPLLVMPINQTQINFVSPSAPNAYGGRGQVPTNIYSVDYFLRCNYYYYPELGWTPHSPDQVAHAQKHYDDLLRNTTVLRPDQQDRSLRWYLQRPGRDEQCFSCGDPLGSPGFYATRVDRREPMGQAAINLLNPVLTQLAQDFSEQHPELMLQAELRYLNGQIMSLEPSIEKQRALLVEMEQQLAALVIRELRADERRSRRRNPEPWEDPGTIAWFEYLRLSDAEVREKELDRIFQSVPPDMAARWSHRLLTGIMSRVDGAEELIGHVERRLRETPDHLQGKVLKQFILIILQVMSEADEP